MPKLLALHRIHLRSASLSSPPQLPAAPDSFSRTWPGRFEVATASIASSCLKQISDRCPPEPKMMPATRYSNLHIRHICHNGALIYQRHEPCGGVKICRFKSRQDNRISVSTFSIKPVLYGAIAGAAARERLLIRQSKPTVII